jgi:hypothetical protein
VTGMKNPTLLKSNVDREQAIEIMEFLYCDYIRKTIYTPNKGTGYIIWIDYNDNEIAKWTNEYRNIMISKDFLNSVKR